MEEAARRLPYLRRWMGCGSDASNRGSARTDRDSERECGNPKSRRPVGLSQHDLVKVKAVNAE